MTSVSGSSNEEDTMRRLLQWLTKKRLLHDTELQQIMCKETLADKKLEIYKILMEIKENTVANKILNTLRNLTATIAPRTRNNGNHPLLNAVIADCIFGFLPIKDILNSRLVCLPWSIASKSILRQRVTIDFKTSGPSNFLHVFDNPFATEVPFQNFKFSDNANGWDVFEIHNFFKQWGHNIKNLTFETKCLLAFDKNKILSRFDITPLICMATNLVKLKVVALATEDDSAIIAVRLLQLTFIKHLTFKGERCWIYIDKHFRSYMNIKPIKIHINSVTFQTEEPSLDPDEIFYFGNLLLSYPIDFSNATNICLKNEQGHGSKIGHGTKVGINMAKTGILNTKNLSLINMDKILNWSEAKGSVYFLHLDNAPFKECNQLKIKQLLFRNSDVDISVLPLTIEKLHFAESTKFIHSADSKCLLPMLKYLCLIDPSDFYLMPRIAYCSNLVEIELGQSCINENTVTLNIQWIPKSVKRLRINSMQVEISNRDEINGGADQQIQDERYVLKLDTLILEDYLHCLDTTVNQIMSKIKPSVLVVTCMDSSKLINTTTICDFVCTNRHLEKIIIGSAHDLHKKAPFYNSVLSYLVKDKANYYVFENHLENNCNKGNGKVLKEYAGKRISFKAFSEYRTMDRLDSNNSSNDFKTF